MNLLRKLTLVYVAVLIPTLASSLIAILVYLRRIANTLDEARAALVRVRDETAPLDVHLRGLHEAIEASADELSGAKAHVARADERLGHLTKQDSTESVA